MVHTMVSIAARATFKRWLAKGLIEPVFVDPDGEPHYRVTIKGRALIAQVEGRA